MNRKSSTAQMKSRKSVSASGRGEKTNDHVLRHGHSGIIMAPGSKMETRTSYTEAYFSPKSPDVRCDTRREYMAKRIAQEFSEKNQQEQNEPIPKTEFCSTTQRDFSAQGFVPEATQGAANTDYKTDQAVTFWSENCQRIQGVTAARTPRESFKKSSKFSTPISHRLDEIHPPPNDQDAPRLNFGLGL